MFIILDDERTLEQVAKLVRLPRNPSKKWDICRSYAGFVKLLESLKEPPVFVSFDHDLGHKPEEGKRELTGYVAAGAMVEIAQDKKWKHLPKWAVHSMNPVGRKNIEEFLKNAEKYIGNGVPAWK